MMLTESPVIILGKRRGIWSTSPPNGAFECAEMFFFGKRWARERIRYTTSEILSLGITRFESVELGQELPIVVGLTAIDVCRTSRKESRCEFEEFTPRLQSHFFHAVLCGGFIHRMFSPRLVGRLPSPSNACSYGLRIIRRHFLLSTVLPGSGFLT